MQLSNEAGQSQVMADVDVKGKDWNGQVKLGTPQFLGECRALHLLLYSSPNKMQLSAPSNSSYSLD
jgi:hypothetical protein